MIRRHYRTATKKSSTTIEGTTVRVGDTVCFKSDIEQSGRITAITSGEFGDDLTLESEHGFRGEYIGGSKVTTKAANDCWL